MFNKHFTVYLILIAVLSIMTEALAVKIWGGRIDDIVVLVEGTGPGQMKSFRGTWPNNLQPTAIDIDIKGNIYLLDPVDGRIQIFSTSGKFVREIKIKERVREYIGGGITLSETDIAADNEGNVYIVDWDLTKFSPDVKATTKFGLPRWPNVLQRGFRSINTDYLGNVYFYYCGLAREGEISEASRVSRIYLYEKGKRLKTQFDIDGGPTPQPVVQKVDSLGRVIFLRNGYLHTSNVKEIVSGVLKDSLRLPEGLTSEFRILGFDLNFNIYLIEDRHWVYQTSKIASAGTYITILHRYKIEKDKLMETGRVYLNFNDLPKEDLEIKATNFVKRYVVNGNGEIYFLHGTIKKLYLSKIIFEEFKDEK